MILRFARAACGRRTSSSIVWPRSIWCHSTKRVVYGSHKYCADLTFSQHYRQVASSEIPTKCCHRQRACQLGAFRLGKGCFDQLIGV